MHKAKGRRQKTSYIQALRRTEAAFALSAMEAVPPKAGETESSQSSHNVSNPSHQSEASTSCMEQCSSDDSSRCSDNAFSPVLSDSDISEADLLSSVQEFTAFVDDSRGSGDVADFIAPRGNGNEDLLASLERWAVEHNITHGAVSSLLKILRTHECHTGLPSDARALLQIRRKAVSAEIVSMPPGRYYHIGLHANLSRMLERLHVNPQTVQLSLSIDGLPISKSSKMQLWPIQCIARGVNDAPFLVGVYAGNAKPNSANEFLGKIVTELEVLMAEGICIKGSTVRVCIKSIICDAPARAFVFQIAGHNAFSGCPKCTVEGQHIKNRTVFLESGAAARTDQFSLPVRPRPPQGHFNPDQAAYKLYRRCPP
ncbi:uncharacterized protein LOC135378828 isoform X1 [Ornithodoros turicata]|uniref:uncharacterized protein LOC135378828 isoform X1 n=1 Tax=Ornithodoros turicata TaxID=34597 RepID=UPI003138B96D